MARLVGVSFLFSNWLPKIFFDRKMPKFDICEEEQKYRKRQIDKNSILLLDKQDIKRMKYTLKNTNKPYYS